MITAGGRKSEKLLSASETSGSRSGSGSGSGSGRRTSLGGIESAPGAIAGSAGMSYRPLKELGEGGTARVLLAYGVGNAGFTKLVVLKMLRRHLASDPMVRQMFQAEGRLSARLNHPNLVQVTEVVEGEIPFLVMEYLDGKSLSSMRAGDRITSRMLLTIICEVLIGLHHAHELRDYDGTPLSIVHRDVSPHNVFVTYDGAVKVLDFGIAKAATVASHTETGEIKGKLTYMAPEQLLGGDIDRRADIFSVGCMLWEAGVGRRLWENVSEPRLIHHLATGDIPRPSDRGPIDPLLEIIIVKATAARAEDRHSTALELHRDLSAYLEATGSPCSIRDIGAILADMFKEQREKNREAIATALREPAPINAGGLELRSGPISLTKTPTSPTGLDEMLSVTPFPSLTSPPVTPVPSLAIPSLTPKKRNGWIWPVTLLLLVIAGGAAWRFQAAPSAPRPATTAATTAAEPVRIHVRVMPEGSIEIDGKSAGADSATLNVAADDGEHSLRASAPGYLVHTQTIKFDRSQDIEVRLEPVVATLPSAARPSAAVRTGAPAIPAAPHRVVPPKRKGDSPAADNACTPPYYFVEGIKTYRPECLQ